MLQSAFSGLETMYLSFSLIRAYKQTRQKSLFHVIPNANITEKYLY